MRNPGGLDMVAEVEGRAEQHQCHVVVVPDVVVALVQFDFEDGADLGMNSWSGQYIDPCHHMDMDSFDPSAHENTRTRMKLSILLIKTRSREHPVAPVAGNRPNPIFV